MTDDKLEKLLDNAPEMLLDMHSALEVQCQYCKWYNVLDSEYSGTAHCDNLDLYMDEDDYCKEFER